MITSIVFASIIAAHSANALPQKSLVSEQELANIVQVELMSSMDKLTLDNEKQLINATKAKSLTAPVATLANTKSRDAKDALSHTTDLSTSVSPN